MKSQCKACRYYSKYVDCDYGSCMRYPPAPVPTTGDNEDYDEPVGWMWPIVMSVAMCGEFSPRIFQHGE